MSSPCRRCAENVPLVRHALAGLAEALAMEPAEVADLKTVVTEACMNVVTHAYDDGSKGLLEVEAWPDDQCLVVTVRDYGSGIRPLADVEHRSLRLGLPLIAALTSSFEVSGAAGKGTEVTMKVPFAPNGTRPERVPEVVEETRISLPAGELLAPILSRVVAMFATRADLSVDELSDAVLLSDAISAGGTDGFPDGTAHLSVSEQAGSFEVRVGPLREGGGRKLLDGMRIPELDASLETLADEVRIDSNAEGEVLAIRIGERLTAAGRRLLAQLSERAAEDPRDVHLRVADLLGDLRLGQILGEAQPQDLALDLVEDPGAGIDRGPVLDQAERGVVLADPLRHRRLVARLGADRRPIEGNQPPGGARLERLQHVGLVGVEEPGDLGDGR